MLQIKNLIKLSNLLMTFVNLVMENKKGNKEIHPNELVLKMELCWSHSNFLDLDITITVKYQLSCMINKTTLVLLHAWQIFLATFHHLFFIKQWCPKYFVLQYFFFCYVHVLFSYRMSHELLCWLANYAIF